MSDRGRSVYGPVPSSSSSSSTSNVVQPQWRAPSSFQNTMVEKFFSMKHIDAKCNKSGEIILLSGPPCCGKTSLLFQYAFNCALENSHAGRCVVFICNRRRLENKPPYLSQGIDPSSNVFQRIQMKYVDNDEGIKKYFAAFHLHKTFPLAILVDDFGDFFDERTCKERLSNPRGRDMLMVRTLALCHDAVMHANERLPPGNACKLLFSDTHYGDTPRSLFIYKRWISSIYTIKGDRCGSFLLKSSSSSGGCTKRPRSARYSIALQYLMLEEITDESEQSH